MTQERTQCGCGCGYPVVRAGAKFRSGHNKRKPIIFTINAATGCWEWGGVINNVGYGTMTLPENPSEKRTYLAHRYFYEQAAGPIPAGMQVDHLCRNTRCVNPAHLEAVLPVVNVHRSTTTRLSAQQVREIRSSDEPARAVATRFGITPDYVWQLRRRARRWPEVLAA